MRRFMLRLAGHFLMFDRQRTVMRGHFPVVLSRDWIDGSFRPLVEHPGSFNQILGARHGTPLMQMLAWYVGRIGAPCPANPVQIGVLNRFRRTGPSSCRREPEPAHLDQARPAIPAVKQADQRPHDRTSLFDRERHHTRGSISGALLRFRKMASSAPPGVSRPGPDEAASRNRDRHPGMIRSPILTIFWRCGWRYFSSRT